MALQFFRCLRFLFAFLAEQPGQLKYIEWPSFQSTVILIATAFNHVNYNVHDHISIVDLWCFGLWYFEMLIHNVTYSIFLVSLPSYRGLDTYLFPVGSFD